MRHDKQYRRVLKSQDYFLQKYKFLGVMIFFGYYVVELFLDKKVKMHNKNLKEELSKLEEQDLSKNFLYSTNS